MSDETSEPTEVVDKQSIKYLVMNASGNPAELEWPRDVHGFTSALKHELLVAAGRVNGFDDKQTVLLNTLMVAIAHIKARYDKDRKFRTDLAKWSRDLDANIGAAHTYSS